MGIALRVVVGKLSVDSAYGRSQSLSQPTSKDHDLMSDSSEPINNLSIQTIRFDIAQTRIQSARSEIKLLGFKVRHFLKVE